ncbi:MAG: hypothetical protein KDC46_07645 [Thermoleophilia bacterium]|nr:hypothetical protein [Thermoleophilia bacterium]
MTTPTTIVHGFAASRPVLLMAGGAAVVNAGLVLAGVGQEPKSASEKVGTAISHGAIIGTGMAVSKPFMRTLLLGALAGDVAGNLASAALRGDDADAPNPRPGNAWTDVTGAIGRDARDAAKRNALVVGTIGLLAGGAVGVATHQSLGTIARWAVVGGGAGAGIGAASGALDGAWRGLYQGTGIAIGRGIDHVRMGGDSSGS